MKKLILASAAIFTVACTNSTEHEDRLDFYLEQNELCLEEADTLSDIAVCQDIFHTQMDAEYKRLDRELEEILSDS